MRGICLGLIVGGWLALMDGAGQRDAPVGGYPAVVALDQRDRARLDAGEQLVKIRCARGRDFTVVGAVRVEADGQALVDWASNGERLRASRYLSAAARFSNPPRLDDLAGLVLGESDLDDLRRCRPRACGLKLSDPEIARLQRVISDAGADWRTATQRAFRELILERVVTYRRDGHAGFLPNFDKELPLSPAAEFRALLDCEALPAVARSGLGEYLLEFPRIAAPGIETSFYWTVESFGAGKPIVSVMHESVVRHLDRNWPDVLVVAKRVFATHYITGSLSVTTITSEPGATIRYLIYVSQSRIDLFDGPFAGVMRRAVESRVRGEAAGMLERLRRRIDAPGSGSGR